MMKNPTYERQQISCRVRTVAPIPKQSFNKLSWKKLEDEEENHDDDEEEEEEKEEVDEKRGEGGGGGEGGKRG